MISPIMRCKQLFLAASILLIFFPFNSRGQSSNPPSSCTPSSCGNITDIRFPFRLGTDPISCGYNRSYFALDCQNNRPVLQAGFRRYYVQEINYDEYRVRLVDPGIIRGNLSSCGIYSNTYDDWPDNIFDNFLEYNVPVGFIHCLSPVNSLQLVRAPFCGNRSRIFANSSVFYSYVMVGRFRISDLEESCTVDRVDPASTRGPMLGNPSWASVYDSLSYGFELSWFRVLCGECGIKGFCSLVGNTITCRRYCREDTPISESSVKCQFEYWGLIIGLYGSMAVAGLMALRFVIGFPLLIWLVVHKWRRRHLSMDKTIEDFLQHQNHLAPIKYSYSEIKKMTNNFSQRLGEGGYGTVYKGKLRSGPYVAVKTMEQSMSSEEEFISEVGTIGRIHHVNIVQLVGFCVEGSKCALVYEFLPNGSLDRYIFNQQSLDFFALKYDKMFEIALGVARGIEYLHHGCDMQILHFDIKPHNILLDEKFKPKISDFGLAQLYPTNNGIVNLTSARGTVGYMAPEMFYRNIGGISYKADVYSFGMLLMEIASRRRNMDPYAEDITQIYFPSWAYDQLCAGKDIEIMEATEEEMKIIKRIIIVALWCIQMKPDNRPPMNKIVEMLEADYELQMPPKPFIAPRAISERHGITRTYSVDYIGLNSAEK